MVNTVKHTIGLFLVGPGNGVGNEKHIENWTENQNENDVEDLNEVDAEGVGNYLEDVGVDVYCYDTAVPAGVVLIAWPLGLRLFLGRSSLY